MKNELNPRQPYTPPEAILSTDELDEFLNALVEADDRGGSFDGSEEYYEELKAFFENEIAGKLEENQTLLSSMAVVYQDRIEAETQSKDLNDWPQGIFLDIYKLAYIVGMVEEKQKVVDTVVSFAKKVNVFLNTGLNYKTYYSDFTEKALLALELCNELVPNNPQVMNCIAELETCDALIDHASDSIARLNGDLEGDALASAREEVKVRLHEALDTASEASELEKDEEDESSTWETLTGVVARWHLAHGEKEEFVSMLGELLKRNPLHIEANLLLVRHKLANEPGSEHNCLVVLMTLLEVNPGNEELIYLLGLASIMKGDHQAAMHYKSMLKPDSQYSRELKSRFS